MCSAQGWTRAAPGKSGLPARGEGERVLALESLMLGGTGGRRRRGRQGADAHLRKIPIRTGSNGKAASVFYLHLPGA